MVHIAVLMMVKNESKRLQVSLDSIKGFANSLVIFDTGSTDNTIEIATHFCNIANIPLRLKQGEFVNFCTSRNVSLEFADTFSDIDFILLLDCNDELRFADNLRKFCESAVNIPSTGFLICQEWFSGQYNKYYNVRLVKAREGWRYMGSVHEYMKNTKYVSDAEAPKVFRVDASKCTLYQDRTQDDDKTGKRFHRDKELLLADFRADPASARTVFYLAQTYSCLDKLGESFYYYKLRTTMGDFQEEVFTSYLRCGEMSIGLSHPWADTLGYLMKSFEIIARVEPLILIADHYRFEKQWVLAFMFIDLACKLMYPDHLILFVDKIAYDYKRWHLLGIIGYYSRNFTEGKIGCERALAVGLQVPIDKRNLSFYTDLPPIVDENLGPDKIIPLTTYKPPEIAKIVEPAGRTFTTEIPETKAQFIEKRIVELMNDNKIKLKQATTMAGLQWKQRNKK